MRKFKTILLSGVLASVLMCTPVLATEAESQEETTVASSEEAALSEEETTVASSEEATLSEEEYAALMEQLGMQSTEETYLGLTETELQSVAQQYAEIMADMSEKEIEQTIEFFKKTGNDMFIETLKTLKTVQANGVGDYKGVGEFKITDKDDKDNIISTSLVLHFDNNDVKFNMELLMVDLYGSAQLNSMEFELVEEKKTLGEKMLNAGQNTVIGMGVVIGALILIAFIISLFKYIPAIQEKFSKKKAEKSAPSVETSAVEQTISQIEEREELADDLELVAVITAAIAASQGTTTDGFVVRSIKRANNSKWQRA